MIPNISSRTAIRTLDLFEMFATTGTPHSLSDLARRIDVPVSTCHGLVKTLQAKGYLYSIGNPRRLYPTKRLFDIAKSIADQDAIVEYVTPSLATLRDATGETIILGKRQEHETVYLEVVESMSVIRYSARPGDLKPLHSSAIGKLILGNLSEGELSELLTKLSLTQITENTITDHDCLLAELSESRKQGYYITRGENVSEVIAMAAPVRLSGETFGIAVAGPEGRMSKALDTNRKALISCCREIEAAFIG
jgi:DNA-binding IclR family transcriptional regulator